MPVAVVEDPGVVPLGAQGGKHRVAAGRKAEGADLLRVDAAVVLTAAFTAWWAGSKPYLYESVARVSIVDIEDPGGVAPDDRRASEVLTLVEHGFVMGTTYDNYNDVMLARLNSRDFLVRFLDEHNVYRFFYPEQWLESENRFVKLRVSTKGLRIIDKKGIDAVLEDIRARGEKV